MSLFKSLWWCALVLGLMLRLPAEVLAGQPSCPVNLGDFGLAVRNAVESSLYVNQDHVVATRGDDRAIGIPYTGVARVVHEHGDGGAEYHYRWVFRDDYAYLFARHSPGVRRMPDESIGTEDGWSKPQAVKAVKLPLARTRTLLHGEGQQLVSEPVRLPLYGQESWMIAVALKDRVVLLDALFGRIVQTFHTRGQKILSVSLTPRFLEVGTQDHLLVYQPHVQTMNSGPQGPVAILPMGRPVEMILQGHMKMPRMNLWQLGQRDANLANALQAQGMDPDERTDIIRQPLSILISQDRIFMIGHNPNFSDLTPFPVMTLTGRIAAAQSMRFFNRDQEPPLPWTVLYVRMQGRPGLTKLRVIDSSVAFDAPSKPARSLSVKTVPDQHVLPGQFLVEADLRDPDTGEFSPILTLILVGWGYQTGLVFPLLEGGGLGAPVNPEHLGQVRSVVPFQQLEGH